MVGCNSSDDKEEDKGQYITAYLTNNIYDLDPANAYTNDAMVDVVSLMFDTLFKLDANKKVQKSLAQKYWITEDANSDEYIMYIRLRNTNWSDGTAVSAGDVVYAWKRLLEVDASYPAAALLFDIKNARDAKAGEASIDDVGISAPETTLVEIHFEQAIDYDQFLLNLTSVALAPLRSDIVAKSPDWAKKSGTMVCSGPFKLSRINFSTNKSVIYSDINWSEIGTMENSTETEIVTGNSSSPKEYKQVTITDFVLERNAYYYRDAEKDKNNLDKSVTPYRICVDCSLTPDQVLAAYEAGALLYVGNIPMDLRSNPAIQKQVEVAAQSLSTSALYLNENALIDDGTEEGSALFADVKVRQALSMAIDRQAIAEGVVYADVATGLIPDGVTEYSGAKKSFRTAATDTYDTLSTNLESAKNLLKEAGINPAKYTFTLTVAAYDDVQNFIAGEIVKAWTALGFKVSLNSRGTIRNNDYYKYTASVPEDLCDDLYAEDLRGGAYEAILFDYVAYCTDPFGMLAPFAKEFSGMGMDMSDPDNYVLPTHMTGYDSEEYNALVETIFNEKDAAKRADLYRQAEKKLMEDLPIIPIIFNKKATMMSDKLKSTAETYYVSSIFTKAKIRSYDKYLAAGKQFVNENFANLAFKDCDDSTYTELEAFKDSNTVYAQFYLDEKAAKEAAKKEQMKK